MSSQLGKFFEFVIYHTRIKWRIVRLLWPGKMIHQILFRNRELSRIISSDKSGNVKPDSDIFNVMNYLEESSQDSKHFGLLLKKFVVRSKIQVESDMWFSYSESIVESSQNYSDMSSILAIESTDEPLIRKTVESFIDLGVRFVIVDGNYPLIGTKGLQEKIELFRKLGLAIIVDIPDCYQSKDGPSKFAQWSAFADLIILHNSRLLVNGKKKNVLLWPGFPFPESRYLTKWSEKKRDFSILGYRHRQRELFAKKAEELGLFSSSLLHSNFNRKDLEFSYTRYIEQIKEARVAFSNGYINSRESIIVGRALESMLSNTLLLYEGGSDLEFFFEPYSDYVPVYNLPDFAEKLKFLLNNLTYAEKIAAHGHRTYLDNFSSHKFWNQIHMILG